jgi:hypothetical protein
MMCRMSVLIVVVVGVSWCPLAAAGIVNGGFETGTLDGWSSTGPVSVFTEEYARDFLGLPQAPADGIWRPAGGDYFASLWSTDSAGTDVSVLGQTFEAPAGALLRFDYFFDFGDFVPDYDMAGAILVSPQGDTILLEINTPGYELGDDENIDWTTVSYVLPTTGIYALEFVAVDGPGVFESILGIDNVRIEVIPAPGALILGSIGAGILGWSRRRRVL